MEAVVTKLRNVGALENTYVVFTSDNGWYHGEHRIFDGKRQPYEESARVPLLVRGPGVGAGSTTDKLALNTDFFPTFMELAGAQTQTPSYVDGRSLRPVLDDSATPTTWRTAILLETRFEGSTAKSFYAIRTSSPTLTKRPARPLASRRSCKRSRGAKAFRAVQPRMGDSR